MKKARRNHGATFKMQVALAAVKGDKMLAELAEQSRVHPTQITEWKQHLLARALDQIRSRCHESMRGELGEE